MSRPGCASLEERDRALAALKELEFDHRTGKISDEDYRALVGPLRRQAGEALRALEHGDRRDREPEKADVGAECPACGAPVAAETRFCSECGSPVCCDSEGAETRLRKYWSAPDLGLLAGLALAIGGVLLLAAQAWLWAFLALGLAAAIVVLRVEAGRRATGAAVTRLFLAPPRRSCALPRSARALQAPARAGRAPGRTEP